MELTSSAFSNNQTIPVKYTCDGEDISPPLKIKRVPQGAKGLVLIVDDPDAPMKTWVHWLVFNIDSSVSEIAEGQVPQGGTEGLNDFGRTAYGGPCPPAGLHHYYFRLYALKKMLELSSSVKKEDVEKSMKDSVIASAELIGLYGKK